MELYLVRHAIAEPRGGTDDALRDLTEEGSARLRAAAAGLQRLDVEVEAVLSSPYRRAWRTATILREEIGWPAPERLDALAATASPADCLEALGARSERSLALVGHEPHLSGLASLLLAGDERSVRLDLRKAGVLCLDLARPDPGSATLRWLATPRMLRRLGR
ncbi:MAG: phosphohistidine phosphatase SixA [Thermoleophilia bacterium]|nr:phosphohistidine phosphatase SixA [Gaiellaceae bacterium]MDW8338747.1 phosphohistidine phosphatase SixA [Thermoleophilia bacterium]